MAQRFRGFLSLRDKDIPLSLKNDLEALQRWLISLDDRVAATNTLEPIGSAPPASGNPGGLRAHANTHAIGGNDPLQPHRFLWDNDHVFKLSETNANVNSRVPVTIRRADGQTTDVFNIEDEDNNEKLEVNSDFLVSLGAPTAKGSTLNLSALSIASATGAGADPSGIPLIVSSLSSWYRTEDITGVADNDPLADDDPIWLDQAQFVAGSGNSDLDMRAVSFGVDMVGPKYFTTTQSLNGYPVVTRHTDQGLVGFGANGLNSIGINDPFTIICVYRASANSSFMLGNGGATFAECLQFPGTEVNTKAVAYHLGTPTDITSTFDNSVGFLGSTDWHIGVFTSNGVYIEYRHDGTTLAQATAAVAGIRDMFSARTNGQYSSSQGCGLVELIHYDSELSTANIELLENYLIDKYFVGTSDLAEWELSGVVDGVIKQATGFMGVGTASPAAKLDVLRTAEQLRLSYDASNYASFTVDANGNLAIALTGTTPAVSIPYEIEDVDAIQFDLTFAGSHAEGKMHWSSDDGTLSVGLPGGTVELQVGQEILVRVKNTSGAQITNGQVVYINGATGTRPTIALAKADADITSHVLGMATEDIDDNQFGYVTTAGLVRDINTNGLGAGSTVYLSAATAGAYTTSRPADPNHRSEIGTVVVDSATVGTIQFYVHEYHNHNLDNEGVYFGDDNDSRIVHIPNNLVIDPDVDSNTGKLQILDGVEITQSNASILGLKLTAASGATDVFDILTNAAASVFKVTTGGRLYGPDGIVPMAFYSRTDNDGITPKGLFEFRRDSGADGSSFHTKWYGAAGATILDLTMAGVLRKGGSASTEYLYETGSFDEVTFTGKPTFDSGWLTKKIAEPSTPASNYGSVFLDTSDGILKIKHDDGTVVNLENGAVATPFDCYLTTKTRNADDQFHGGLEVISTTNALDSGTPINDTLGLGKVVLVINAGSDFAGDITITGTSVDRETGNETGSDTSVITIDALTTDNSSTDGNSVTIAEFAGAYISDKWFRGAITITTADVTLTDVDVYQIAFEQANDQTEYSLDTLDVSAYATNASAWISGYLYSVEVTGDKCDIVNEAGGAFQASVINANKWYRMRRGNIAKTLDGSTDGFYFDLTLGPGANNYWENINAKVWTLSPLSGVVAVGGAGSFDPGTSYTWTADQTVNDNVKWLFGTDGVTDSEVYWDGSNLRLDGNGGGIDCRGSGGLFFTGSLGVAGIANTGAQFNWTRGGANTMACLTASGYFVWKTNGGATGMYLDSSNNLVVQGSLGDLSLNGGNEYNASRAGANWFKCTTAGGYWLWRVNGAGTAMYLSTAKDLYLPNDSQSIYVGASADLQIYFNGSTSSVLNTATGTGLSFQIAGSEKFRIGAADIDCEVQFRIDDNQIRFKESTAPSTPASTYAQLFLDSVTGNLSILKDTGTKVDLEASSGASPLTTKGDVWGYSTVDARIPVGTNNHVLTADSTQALGVKWAAVSGGGTPLTPTASKTSAYTAAAGDYVLCDTNTTGAFTVTLPAASTAGTGAQIGCKKTTSDANTLTIDGDSAETIDGELTKTLLAQYDSIVLLCDGSNWHIIG